MTHGFFRYSHMLRIGSFTNFKAVKTLMKVLIDCNFLSLYFKILQCNLTYAESFTQKQKQIKESWTTICPQQWLLSQ